MKRAKSYIIRSSAFRVKLPNNPPFLTNYMEHGQFGQMGFVPNSGRLVWANGNSMKELTGGLNTPAGLKQVNDHTWYVTSTGDCSLLKVTYD